MATVKFTQPVVVHKLDDEYDLPCGRLSKTPAAAGQVLGRDDGGGTIDNIEATVYHSGTDTCMFIMQWTGLDIYNGTKRLARHIYLHQVWCE